MEVAGFEEKLAQGDGGVVRVREEGVLDDDARPSSRLEDLDEVLKEEEGGLAGFEGEVWLDLRALLPAEGGLFAWTMFGASTPWRIMFMVPMMYARDFFSLP